MKVFFLVFLLSLNLLSTGHTIANGGMVTSATSEASKVGANILKKGGNAADAAVATAFALSVTEPYSAGLGGGGFLLYYSQKENKIYSLDFRERAPIKANSKMYFKKNKLKHRLSINGHLAVAVPHTVWGLFEFHKKFGSIKWKKLINPSIKLAKEGFIVNETLSTKIRNRFKILNNYESSKKIFIKDNKPLPLGFRLIQKDLAKTLERIKKDPNDFYEGKTARLLVKEMKKNNGLMELRDLKNRKVTFRKPICTNFLKTKICSMGPPSSGGVVLSQTLQLLQKTKFQKLPWHSVDAINILAQSLSISYADRATWLGDPDQIDIPLKKLLSEKYIKEKSKLINQKKKTASIKIKSKHSPMTTKILKRYESKQTTHFNVVDKDLNAVSLTFTINGNFGSGVVASGTGIILNNEMDDFAIAPGVPNLYGLVGGSANAIASQKIPLSSMTPIIALKNRKLLFCAGSPGGSTIITTGLHIILNLLHYKMNTYNALAKKRIHMQWLPDKLYLEPFTLDANTIQELKKRGHDIVKRNHWGNASVIKVLANNKLEGAVDPRGCGEASGIITNKSHSTPVNK